MPLFNHATVDAPPPSGEVRRRATSIQVEYTLLGKESPYIVFSMQLKACAKGSGTSEWCRKRNPLSLTIRGAWGQIAIAAMLITVLPGMLLLWLWMHTQWNESVGVPVVVAVGSVCLTLIALGYILLFKYPVNMVRLRSYLQTLAQNRLPERITLSEDEDDIAAVHYYLKQIVRQAEERLRLLEENHKAALVTERHRIMVESIGALCHHVGQPAAVLGMLLHRIKFSVQDEQTLALVVECQDAFDRMADTLNRLREATHYRTEPYLTTNSGGDCQIIRLDRGE